MISGWAPPIARYEITLKRVFPSRSCQYGTPFYTVVGAADVQAGKATDISGIKVVDDNTITFTFTKPNALFPVTISEFFILPQHALKVAGTLSRGHHTQV